MIKCGVQEEFSDDIGSSFLLCSCQISPTDFIVSSIQQTYYFSNSTIKHLLPISYTSIYYVAESDLIIGATSGIPSLHIFTSASPNQYLLQEFVLHQAIINQIFCSPSSNILITVGNKEIKVWDFYPVKKIKSTFNLTLRATLPSSPLCSNGMNLISVDLTRHRIFVPHIQGFILYSFDGAVLEKQLKFTNFITTAVSVLPSPRKYPGLDLSYQTFLYIFRKLAIVESDGLMRIFHKSGKYLLTINPIASASILFVAFLDSEFLITVNTDGDIFLNDIKTSKVKLVFQTGQRPDKVAIFYKPEPRISIISGRHLRIYKISTIWKLFYRPVEAVTSIERFCSSMYSARMGLLSSDGCIFMISNTKNQQIRPNNQLTLLSDNYRKRYLVGTASTRSCSRPISYAYNREFNENFILISLDDSSVCLFDYLQDDWQLKQVLPFKARLVLIIIGTEFLNWIVCCCGFYGDVAFYKFGSWTPLSRLSVGLKQCDFAFWSKKDDILIVLSEDRLNIIGLKRFNLINWHPFRTPKHAAFEEGELIVSYEKGVLYRSVITPAGIDHTNKCNFGHNIVNVSLKYGCHIVVLSNNSIVIGDNQNMASSKIELPFPIFSANFLSSDLDVLVALDHEIMIIDKKTACPLLHPLHVSPDDFDNSKSEPLFKFPVIDSLNNEMILNNKRRMKKKQIQRSSNYEPVEVVLKRIREKIREEEENEFQYLKPEDDFYTPVLSWNLPKNKNKFVSFGNEIDLIKDSTIKFKKIERQPVNVIYNKRLSEILFNPIAYDENGNKIFNYSKNYEELRFIMKNFLKIEELFRLHIAEIPSIIAETDEELDQIYNPKKKTAEDIKNQQFHSLKSHLVHSKSTNCLYNNKAAPKVRRSLSIENLDLYSIRHITNQNEVAYYDEDDFIFESLWLLKKKIVKNNFTLNLDLASSEHHILSSNDQYTSNEVDGILSKTNSDIQTVTKSEIDDSNKDNLPKRKKKRTTGNGLDSLEEDYYYSDIIEIQNDDEDYDSQSSKDSTNLHTKQKKKSANQTTKSKTTNSSKNPNTNNLNQVFQNDGNNKQNSIETIGQSPDLNLTKQDNSISHRLRQDDLQKLLHNDPLNLDQNHLNQESNPILNKKATKLKGKKIKNPKSKTRKSVKSSRNLNTKSTKQSSIPQNNHNNLVDESSQFFQSEFRLSNQAHQQLNNIDNHHSANSVNHLTQSMEINPSNLPNIDSIPNENEKTFQIKEPESDTSSYRRPPSSSRRRRCNSPIDQNDLSQSTRFALYNRNEIDEEEEIAESLAPVRHGRQPLINKDALTLYNPMNVPRIKIRYGANKNNTEKPPIRIQKGTEKRKVIIRRQQLSNETNSIIRNLYY